MSRGDILGCLGADDLLEPTAVERVVEFFTNHPQAQFVHGHCQEIDANGAQLRVRLAKEFPFQEFVDTAKNIATNSAFYRRSVMETIGWLDSSGDDFDLMIRIMQRYEIHRIDAVLGVLRVRTGSRFNPGDFSSATAVHRQTYLVSRRYGGSLRSPISVRYHTMRLVDAFGCGAYWPLLLRAKRVLHRLCTSR